MKYFSHCYLGLALFYLLPIQTRSQSDFDGNNPGIFVRIGTGLDFTKFKDSEFSSMLYSGFMPSFNIQITAGKNYYHQLNLGYAGGKLNTGNGSVNSLDYTYFNADYFLSKSARYTADKRWFGEPGLGINFIYADRKYTDFINQNKSREISGSLSVYYNLLFVVSESKGWTISDRIFVPVLSVISQPEIWPSAGGETDGSTISPMAANMYTMPDYVRINNTITVSKNLSDRNSFHFLYTWDFYQIEEVYLKQRVYHSVVFTYRFTL